LETFVTVSKTALGAQVMKDRSMGLTPQQRSALILCDGKRSAEDVVKLTTAVGVGMADIQKLLDLGLIESGGSVAQAVAAAPAPVQATAVGVAQAMATAPSAPAVLAPESGIDFLAAHNAAITLCSDLGFKGFGLNMALTGVDSIEKLQKIAPEIRRAAGDAKYKSLHQLIFGMPL
jgi:hypothetical protein